MVPPFSARRVTAALATGALLTLVLACSEVLGIHDIGPDAGEDVSSQVDGSPDGDGGAGDARADSSPPIDSTTDADSGGDVTASDGPDDRTSEGPNDATEDTDSSLKMCPPACNEGETKCGDGGLETCERNDGGCLRWSDAPCPGGQTCWGPKYQAYCCGGGPSVCAPSCYFDGGPGDPDAGNGRNNCGRNANESCCTALDVTGGTFLRSYDGVTATDNTNPATVSSFALDKFEVTVGRFRQFVAAANAGWTPDDGMGIHSHLNGGQGLVDSSNLDAGLYEPGWASVWDQYLPQPGAWTSYLESDPVHSTWTNNPSAYEAYAINSVNWYIAYAFCIWDDGFLPSETEWNYAAAGGSDQRVYAWSVPPTSTAISCSNADYKACTDAPDLVGIYTLGYGKYGHADLTGGEWEWTLDYFAAYQSPCFDCAYVSDPGSALRTLRGASWDYPANQLYVATRLSDDPTIHFSNDGFRCARPP